MAKIEGIRIRNYRSLKDITLGKLWNTQQAEPLTPMTAVIGKNSYKLLETLAVEFREPTWTLRQTVPQASAISAASSGS